MNDRFGNAIAAGDDLIVVGKMRAESGTKAVVVLESGDAVHVLGAETIKASEVSDTDHTHVAADVVFTGTNLFLARSAPGGGPGEELPANELGLLLMAAASTALGRAALELGTAAVVDTGTGAANVPTITQADARYLSIADDLSDLSNPTNARSNLGLGTAAVVDTGTGAANVPTITDADARYAASAHTHAGVYQPLDATLTALAALATGADKLAYSTGADTFAETTFTAAGRALVDDASAAAQRTTLGLGTAALVNTGTGAANVPTMAEFQDIVDPASAGLPMKFDELGDVPTHSHSYQAGDATLTALAALNATAGLVEQTGADAFTKRALGVAASTSVPTRADADARYLQLSLADAKGDLIAATAADTLARVAVGANGTVLIADSAQTAGVKWGTRSTQVALMHWGGGLTWTNMPAAATIFTNYLGQIHWFDATNYTEVRFQVAILTAGYSTAKLILKYATSYPVGGGGPGSYSDIGTSEVSCPINTAGVHVAKSSWVALAAAAKADIVLCVIGSGGDGIVDPQFYDISAEFR